MPSVRSIPSLPAELALFPLSGVILLPFGHLPLNVFEPRYINLIDAALGQGRIVGIVQPRELLSDPIPSEARLFDVGTVGRIVHFADPGNGRYMVTLEGVARFRLTHECAFDPSNGYRTARVDYAPFTDDTQPIAHEDGPGRARLIELVHGYYGALESQDDWDALNEAPYETLVTSLAMSCPFSPAEKQALLECASHSERARLLISLFEINLDSATPGGSIKH